MNKKDLIILVVLVGLWMAWPAIDRHFIKKRFFPHTPAPAGEVAAPEAVEPAAVEPPVGAGPVLEEPEAVLAEAPVEPEPVEEPIEPGQTAVLENDHVRVTVSSRGASVVSAELKDYRQTVDPESDPVLLDFAASPALAYTGITELSRRAEFTMEVEPGGTAVRFERRTPSGLVLQRRLALEDGYLLDVRDEFTNGSPGTVAVPAHALRSGVMENLDGKATKGVVYLGADTLSPGGEGVKHWGRRMPKWFAAARTEQAVARLPRTVDWPLDRPVDWAAAKNKYFVQILTPEFGAENVIFHAGREVSPQEAADPDRGPKAAVPERISLSLMFPAMPLEAGQSYARTTRCYIGPKKYSELKRLALHQADVMEFGMWAPIGRLLLVTMNGIHKVLRNYGVAIILLTIIVRVIFWPITHKSTESMKRMQAIQPLVTEIREKYKNNAQKQQQEIMALYKEHKVNPLGGCLPMLVQIPVFIALFVVLRSAIELRFAPFLWIADLSQPENLLKGVLPIPLNILPIFMAVTMAWQQRLTPGADPNQQRMFMFMPVMMLVLFYNFASGLVLYWSTNQCLMIAQQLMMHRKSGGGASQVPGPKSKVESASR